MIGIAKEASYKTRVAYVRRAGEKIGKLFYLKVSLIWI